MISPSGDINDDDDDPNARDKLSEAGAEGDEDAKEDEGYEEDARDKDLQDDLREASQILFYLSRESGTVKRDTMLRQIGLIKGLMGFTE